MKKILVADDEQNMCRVLKLVLEKDGYRVITAARGEEALDILKQEDVDLIISDLMMPGISGLDLLKGINAMGKQVPFLIVSAYGTIQAAVEAIKLGAADFITKPFNKDLIRHRVKTLVPLDRSSILSSVSQTDNIVYASRAMQEIMDTVQKIAPVQRPVLILGESGSGKEMIAQAIHQNSTLSKSRPYVSINCPSIPESLFESELFGYKRGAFTSAAADSKGKILVADGGTLFLDEIAEIPPAVQSKLLRFLEDKTFFPLGDTRQVKVDTRIIAATNKDIDSMVKEGTFRNDLYYRINTLVIQIPPLRERKEDIEPLVGYFMNTLSDELSLSKKTISCDVLKAFCSYSWPGNVRELKNIVERMYLMSSGEEISLADVPEEILMSFTDNPATDSDCCGDRIAAQERLMLERALLEADWNLTKAAQQLGISRSAIRWRIKKHQLK